jgi:hypothetical protein
LWEVFLGNLVNCGSFGVFQEQNFFDESFLKISYLWHFDEIG